jgi:hypothetical protein
MKNIRALGRIRTHQNIRTRHSIFTSIGPGHAHWPRLKETEQLRMAEKCVRCGKQRIWR